MAASADAEEAADSCLMVYACPVACACIYKILSSPVCVFGLPRLHLCFLVCLPERICLGLLLCGLELLHFELAVLLRKRLPSPNLGNLAVEVRRVDIARSPPVALRIACTSRIDLACLWCA
uniref:Uncharacterized protein n=1 Tax=Haptolina brevifila TaxID=156173 RepID=A0A7S2HS89_9EUKA